MKNESLGLRLLNKLDRLSKGQHIYEVDELENDGTAEEAAEATASEEGDTSETLRKLRGHLYRFQEAEGDKKAVAAGTIGGLAAGRQLARYAHGQQSGANAAIKATKAGAKEAKKNLYHFGTKANIAKAQSKVAKLTGNIDKAQKLQKVANSSANAAYKAANTVDKANKTIKGLKGTMNAAGRAGGFKGALIGGTAAYLGKKAYDHFKK